jgi:SAM-dependent methyltransferase
MSYQRPDDLAPVDLGWQPEPLWEEWPNGRDTQFVMWRMEQAFRDVAIQGGGGRMLDVACGNAFHAPEFVRAGWRVYGLEPSSEMIVRANAYAADHGVRIDVVRGIGEYLPFEDETFDRVICMSSLDHYANPAAGMREMARVLRRDGRIVIGLVNYAGLGCRLSRALYRAQRRTRLVPRGKRLLWDDPTEGEHTFEGKTKTLQRFAAGTLELERTDGASLFWGVPGWGGILGVIPGGVSNRLLHGLDRIARRVPNASDFVVTTWRKP